MRPLRVTGQYASKEAATVCVILRSGNIVTGDGRAVHAPAVIPARHQVEADDAELIVLVRELT